ncbi:MAG: DUF192 domain-containing protein [Gloeomargarita sp. SKYBB_i_bin120]|nr:DUF192 domain-containing protein [Gloeomargarita sp. SKYG98]MCS7291376.1 DUF192 domain-containing protein [Gloeomargarita sp. SKYB120]MDW8176936.1 DUF192 domain-containing protein [Gloeomargarita sp. SKYBB_i_bin120]
MFSGNLRRYLGGAVLAVVLTGTTAIAEKPQYLPVRAQFQHNGQRVLLEVAWTPEQQALGLMYRERLVPDRGMLFPFYPPRPVQFWMKNMRAPIDMVFLRENRVIAIYPNVPPCPRDPCPTYGPDDLVDAVIELAPGRAQQLGLRVGDTLIVRLIRPSGVPKRE